MSIETKSQPFETELQGKYLPEGGDDATKQRVKWLCDHYLTELVVNHEMWEVLYQDPEDGRYWERTEPQNGFMTEPTKLSVLSREQVRAKYNLL